jgi:acyl carrier protein
MELDHFVCFSSAAAVLGERSRAPYAAANAFVDALVAERRARNLAGSSVNWGLWAGRDADDSDVRFFVRSGLSAMPVESALDALGKLLVDDGAGRVNWHPLVAALDMPRLRAALETRQPAAILRAFSAQTQTSGGGRAIEQLRGLDARAQEARLTEIISVEARAVLELTDDDRLDVERGFFDLGMDSLMSVDLKGRLEIAFGMSLPSTLTMDYPSVSALAAYFRDAFSGEAPAHQSAVVPVHGVVPAFEDDASYVGDLDDDGVAIALAEELRTLELELQS